MMQHCLSEDARGLTRSALQWVCGLLLAVLAALAVSGALIQARAATPEASTGPRAALGLPAQTRHMDLVGALSMVLLPADGARVPPQLSSQAFEPVQGNPRAGFGKEVMWLRFTVRAEHTRSAGTWWLEVGPAFTDDLALYVDTPEGLQLLGQAGTEHPFEQRPLAYRHGLFALQLPTDLSATTYYLRLESRTTRTARLTLWRPMAFAEHLQRDTATQGLFFGCLLFAGVMSLILGSWLREPANLIYAAYIGISGLNQLLSQGYAQQWLFPQSIGLFNPLLGTAMLLQAGLGCEMVRVMRIDLHLPALAKVYRRSVWALVVALMPLAWLGQFHIVSPVIQACYAAQSVLMTGIAIVLWRRGEQTAPYFLASFATLLLAVLLFLPRNLGLLPLNFWTENMLQVSMFVHLLLMNLAVARHVKSLRDETDSARNALLNAAIHSAAELDTKVKERTTELQQALLQANEASRAKTEFLARVTHDLRSPLTAVLGFAQLLPTADPTTTRYAGNIRLGAQHMLTLVNDLIEYARGASSDQLELSPTYLHGVLDAVAQEATVLAQARHNRFVLDLCPELPNVVMADGKRLRQVLINLLQNAAKFTHDGVITLRVGADTQGGRTPAITPVLFEVQDTGCGIPPDDIARVLSPFFRSDATASTEHGSQGLGLGLAITDTWVQRMGGNIAVLSQLGQGSTFRLRIPMRHASEQDMSPPQMLASSPELPALDGQGRRVWLVEDNREIRALLAEELRRTGFEVVHLSNAEEVKQRMALIGATAPSLVLTDYQMPGGNGDVVLASVRQQWPGVPVVLLSATQMSMDPPSGHAHGAHPFDASLMKPIDLASLRSVIRRVLGLQADTDSTPHTPIP